MRERCCWLTTCKTTGMPGAFSVSAPTKRAVKEQAQAKAEERRSDRDRGGDRDRGDRGDRDRGDRGDRDRGDRDGDGEGDSRAASKTVSVSLVVVRKLANGEMRTCIELRERRRREDLLVRLGLVKGVGGDEYADEFDDDDIIDTKGKGGKNKDKNSTNNSTTNANACDFATWAVEDKREGLRFMQDLSKDARAEETLKGLLSNGSPPAPPKVWVQNENTIEIKSLNRSSLGSRVGRGREGEEGPSPESTELT
ncbi:hypothetical protein B484DRAFT_428237, partial [Ochromonadaceae sp. CCMP2298]